MLRITGSLGPLAALLILISTPWSIAQSLHTLDPSLAESGTPALTFRAGPTVFSEGVAADWNGNVYFNEMAANNRTLRLPVGRDTAIVWRPAKDAPNGIWLDSQNRLIICQARAMVRVNAASLFDNGTDTLYKYPDTGANFNDVTGDSKDNIYFTNYSGKSVFFRNAATKETRKVLSERPSPNGVEWDEERKILYVCENAAGKVTSYNVESDYSLTSRGDFASVKSSDGIVLDALGNVYVVAFGDAVYVYSPSGANLGKISISGSQLTNLAFGGADFKTLYMITNKGLYKLPMKVRGYKTGRPSVSVRMPLPDLVRGGAHRGAWYTVHDAYNVEGGNGVYKGFGIYDLKGKWLMTQSVDGPHDGLPLGSKGNHE